MLTSWSCASCAESAAVSVCASLTKKKSDTGKATCTQPGAWALAPLRCRLSPRTMARLRLLPGAALELSDGGDAVACTVAAVPEPELCDDEVECHDWVLRRVQRQWTRRCRVRSNESSIDASLSVALQDTLSIVAKSDRDKETRPRYECHNTKSQYRYCLVGAGPAAPAAARRRRRARQRRGRARAPPRLLRGAGARARRRARRRRDGATHPLRP